MNFSQYAHSFQVFPRLGLERISALLSELGHPEKEGRYIHIAGTNGKGSVSMALSSVLKENGEAVGLYTSPNLVSVHERIRVNGRAVSDEELSEIIGEVEGACKRVEEKTGETPTPFEIWTASAFLYFSRKKCTYVVLETGLGGRYDATNVIPGNELAVLCRIDFDHTEHLGHTLAEIAANKCGIFKSNQTYKAVLSAPQFPEAEEEIMRQSEALGLKAKFIVPPAPEAFDNLYEIVNYPEIGKIRLPFAGVHQIENITLAIEAAKLLGIAPDIIRRGIENARHPGRMEVLRESPLLMYDGGHNPNGIAALVSSLNRYRPNQKWTVIFACMKDKDIAPALRLLRPLCDKMLCTTVNNNPRAMSAEALTEKAKSEGLMATSAATLTEAIQQVEHTPALICGSLYLYSDLPKHLRSL